MEVKAFFIVVFRLAGFLVHQFATAAPALATSVIALQTCYFVGGFPDVGGGQAPSLIGGSVRSPVFVSNPCSEANRSLVQWSHWIIGILEPMLLDKKASRTERLGAGSYLWRGLRCRARNAPASSASCAIAPRDCESDILRARLMRMRASMRLTGSAGSDLSGLR